MGFIYIIKNTVNDKVYIGQTTRTIEKRWEQHKQNSKSCVHVKLYKNINIIGLENFYIEKLEECDNLISPFSELCGFSQS